MNATRAVPATTGRAAPTRDGEAVLRQRFTIVGMTCSHCEHAVSSELSQLAGVVTVAVDVAAGTVTVESERELDHAEVAAAVDEAGYELVT